MDRQTLPSSIPYPVSWVNRFALRLRRAWLPYWLISLMFFILEAALLHGVSWLDGTYSFPFFQPAFLLMSAWTWGPIALINSLNDLATSVLHKYHDLLKLEDEKSFELLKFRFTSSPARPVLITNFFFISVFLWFVFVIPFDILATWNTPTMIATILSGIPTFALGSGFYYHTIHMLIMVDRTYRLSKPFNLYDREPIFAFSELTARSSLAILGLATLNILLMPAAMTDPGILFLEVTLVPGGLVVFVMPLWEAHRRLVEAKRKLQSTTEKKIESTINQLHLCLETDDTGKMEFLNKALASLVIERDIVDKLPTWPWRKGMLTGVSSAVFLPLLLLVLQMYIQHWLQP
ncbi:MAG: hypothetical protein E4G99_11070 [Anaerolineales bacterium]|nr:MAG: hypothetical protein E4G99_11070 [Anaerolineales bacterium]